MAKYPKDTLSPLKPPKPNFHSYPPGIIPKDLWPHSTSNNQKCHKWCYTPLCTFLPALQWCRNQMVIPTFYSGHQGIKSSRGFIKAQGPVSITKTNAFIKKSLAILIHSIPPREYWQYILKVYSRGSSKTSCQVSMLHQSNLVTTFISIQSGFIKTCISIIHHGKIIQHSSFPNMARYTLHQAANTASRIQYRPAVRLKDSSSQLFTYTSVL
ncbi:hypothetical protein O181_030459 [Austropuccinia psidii MF-1]|uniref:Uncharacterized protein n=1 Tax=Austropuccinia psidii MF-1 TaxID=1389203 RepID=A0A9Q3CU25_9BASI|nr:hypothetical protein [Austropuccinia psidii MF-1]